jgi:hypothetical protein
MSAAALIDKLIEAGAVKKSERTINFTPAFAGYLIWTVGTSQMLDSTVGDWRAILGIFNSALGQSSQQEIVDIVLLFEYYLRHPEMPAIEN